MGCENSNMIVPMPEDNIEPEHQQPHPQHQCQVEEQKEPEKQKLGKQASPKKKELKIKQSGKGREASIKGEKQNQGTFKNEVKTFVQQVKRKSKSERRSMEIPMVEVVNVTREGEEKKKSYCNVPKTKTVSTKRPSEEKHVSEVSIGPSTHSILEDPNEELTKKQIKTTKLDKKVHQEPIESLQNIKMLSEKKWESVEGETKEVKGYPINETKTESVRSERVSIEPFTFDLFVDDHCDPVKKKRQEQLRIQREEINQYLQKLYLRDGQTLDLVINHLERKEQDKLVKVYQQPVEVKKQNKFELDTKQISAKSLTGENTQKMIMECIRDQENRIAQKMAEGSTDKMIKGEQVKNSFEKKDSKFELDAKQISATSLIGENTQKMILDCIHEEETRYAMKMMQGFEEGSTNKSIKMQEKR